MSTIDAIATARRRYLDSRKSRRDWVVYLQTVESLRRQREGLDSPAPASGGPSRGDRHS